MQSLNARARTAGLLYLLLSIAGIFYLEYVPGRIFVTGNAAGTVGNLLAHETLFRLSIFIDLLTVVLFIFVGLALYRLFEGVDRRLGILMVLFTTLSVPIEFLASVNQVAALALARGDVIIAGLQKAQTDSVVMLFLRLHHYGIVVNEIFWGLWLLPMALLVIRSRFIPRVIGFWLIINGIAYISLSAVGILAPELEPAAFNASFPALLAEPVFVLWLLIMGARPKPALATSGAAA